MYKNDMKFGFEDMLATANIKYSTDGKQLEVVGREDALGISRDTDDLTT